MYDSSDNNANRIDIIGMIVMIIMLTTLIVNSIKPFCVLLRTAHNIAMCRTRTEVLYEAGVKSYLTHRSG